MVAEIVVWRPSKVATELSARFGPPAESVFRRCWPPTVVIPSVRTNAKALGLVTYTGGALLSDDVPNTLILPLPSEIVPAASETGSNSSSPMWRTDVRLVTGRFGECLIQVNQDIIYCFDSGAQSHQSVRNAHALALFGRNIAMRRDGGI